MLYHFVKALAQGIIIALLRPSSPAQTQQRPTYLRWEEFAATMKRERPTFICLRPPRSYHDPDYLTFRTPGTVYVRVTSGIVFTDVEDFYEAMRSLGAAVVMKVLSWEKLRAEITSLGQNDVRRLEWM